MVLQLFVRLNACPFIFSAFANSVSKVSVDLPLPETPVTR